MFYQISNCQNINYDNNLFPLGLLFLLLIIDNLFALVLHLNYKLILLELT